MHSSREAFSSLHTQQGCSFVSMRVLGELVSLEAWALERAREGGCGGEIEREGCRRQRLERGREAKKVGRL